MDRPLGRSNSREILCPLLSPQLDLFTPSFPIPHMSLWATGEDTTYKQPPAHVSPSLGYGVIPPTLQYYGVYPFLGTWHCIALWWGVAGGQTLLP